MTLVSPGVQVTVNDDSAYPASGPGTVPLIFIATSQDKLIPGSSTVVAEGTRAINANKPFLLTSQSDALNFFGAPIFQEDNGTVLQGDELNEWGLHSLYSVLGITNQAWAVRADIDLFELSATQVEPRNYPLNQTVWVDMPSTSWGLKRREGNFWVNYEVLTPILGTQTSSVAGADVPLDTFGGNPVATPIYAVVQQGNNGVFKFFQKLPGTVTWVVLDPAKVTFRSVNAPGTLAGDTPPAEGDFWFRLDTPSNGTNIRTSTFQASTTSWTNNVVIGGSSLIVVEARWFNLLAGNSIGYVGDTTTGTSQLYRKNTSMPTVSVPLNLQTAVPGNSFTTLYSDKTLPLVQTVETIVVTDYQEIIADLVAAGFTVHDTASDGSAVTITRSDGRVFLYESTVPGIVPLTEPVGTDHWPVLNREAQNDEPSLVAPVGEKWFTDELYFDFMVTDGQQWKPLDTNDWMVAQIQPDTRPALPDGSLPALEDGDIWVDPADGTYVEFYVYRNAAWMLLDQTDESSTDGILFADMRQADETGVGYLTNSDNTVAKAALLKSSQVDPDCPDPRLFPAGLISCNTRSSGSVVRQFSLNPFTQYDINASGEYSVGGKIFTLAKSVTGDDKAVTNGGGRWRWTTASGNALNGAGLFGRAAQRKLIVNAIAESTLTDQLRSEFMEFNLMLVPGYVELLDELVTLNTDRRETAYIITDVPARLAPNGTDINNWAKNANNAPSNGEIGRTTSYPYSAEYIGWCLGTNVDGKEVVIPGSSVALRTYIYSDSVSYVWFPPAGTQRGIVSNAASVGYINAENEYESVVYNQGQRDVMYTNNINPIAMRPGRGLIVYGDKSLSPDASALDRVNVGRLVVYIRTEIAKISERFLFELNTARVREEFAGAINAFLSNIVQLEGLYDYSVICDTSNNTPARIDMNQLWADIAIRPTKSINFVFVPIRIQNTN